MCTAIFLSRQGEGQITQKLVDVQIMHSMTWLLYLSPSGYLFLVKFKAFPKHSGISTKKIYEFNVTFTQTNILWTNSAINWAPFVSLNRTCMALYADIDFWTKNVHIHLSNYLQQSSSTSRFDFAMPSF